MALALHARAIQPFDLISGAAMRPRMGVTATTVLCALTLEMSIAEFASMQRLRNRELRARFDLPLQCIPVMAAVRPSHRGRIVVLVTCAEAPPEPGDQ
jgi:hypothetical protein